MSRPEEVAEYISSVRPQAIVHLAAANPPRSRYYGPVNVSGAAAVARGAGELGCRLVHVSSDVVHDGRRPPYDESAAPTPISAYGRSKSEGEKRVLGLHPGAVVVRTSLIYDLDEIDRATARLAAGSSRSRPARLWTDVVRMPVCASDLADRLIRLALDLPGVTGHLNLAGDQAVSRARLGRALVSHFGLSGYFEDGPLPLDLEASMPRDLTLSMDRARSLDLVAPGLDEVLATQRQPD